MNMKKHLNILEFTLQSLLRRKFKQVSIIIVFSFVVFVTGSVLFLTYAFKREAALILKGSPELIIQRTIAGRHELVPVNISDAVLRIPGVSKVEPRYWGYYYDSAIKANYTVLASSSEIPSGNRLLKGSIPLPDDRNLLAIGNGVARARLIDIDSEISLRAAGGNYTRFRVSGIFRPESELLTADLIVMSLSDIREFFNFPDGMATDLLVSVSNETEAPVVAAKIRKQFPDTRPILRGDIIRTYDAVFGWRSGLILALFSGALIAFIILAWDKATGLSADEKKEIGILKALGWETSDILEMKFWEGVSVSVTSFLLGIIAAYIHVFFHGAFLLEPVLKGWSVIYPEFRLTPFISFYQVAMLMTFTVIPYIASTIIPSWKASITDPDEVMRG